MAKPIYQRVAVTDAGDIIPGAEYSVVNENTGLDYPIYSDRAGTVLKSPPYFADNVTGTIQFWTDPGTYRVTAVGGVGSYTDRYIVLVGTSAVLDVGTGTGELPPAQDVVLQTQVGTGDAQVATNAERDTLNAAKPTRKNLIVNGNFKINQEGAVSKTAAVGYNFDQWYYDGTYLIAPVEELNLFDGDFSLSWISDASAEWQLVSTAIASGALPAGGWTAIANGDSMTLASVAGNNLWIRFATGVDGLNSLDLVQLEEGDQATSFEHKLYSEYLADCKNYYRKSYNQDVIPGTVTNEGNEVDSVSSGSVVRLVVKTGGMRDNPVVTTYSPQTGTAGKVHAGGVDVNSSVLYIGEENFTITATGTANTEIRAHWAANSRL